MFGLSWRFRGEIRVGRYLVGTDILIKIRQALNNGVQTRVVINL